MVLYPNKLPESERVCSGICIEVFNFKIYCYENFKEFISGICGPGFVRML